MAQKFRKTSVKIWKPLWDEFNKRIEGACLRRDAWFAKVLEREIPILDEEPEAERKGILFFGVHTGELSEYREPINSERAYRFISGRLAALKPKKSVTFTLPEELVEQLDSLCKRRRIVRDSFFNRLILLLVANYTQLTRVFFEEEFDWGWVLSQEKKFQTDAIQRYMEQIPETIDPLNAVRRAANLVDGDFDYLDEPFGFVGPITLYYADLPEDLIPGVDLTGFSIYMDDDHPLLEEAGAATPSLEQLFSSPAKSKPETISKHARKRMQQRGVNLSDWELLCDYAATVHDHRGAKKYYFNKAALRRLTQEHGAAVAERMRGKYAVAANDTLITVGHRTKTIRTDRSQRDLWSARTRRYGGC